MNFSTKGEYGLRAAVNLARSYPKKKNLKAISLEENISFKYLEKLFGDLRRKCIIRSFKGKKGGYILREDPKKITVGEIISCLEGPISIKCYGTKCKMIHNCPSSAVWIKLGEQINKTLNGIRLSDLIK